MVAFVDLNDQGNESAFSMAGAKWCIMLNFADSTRDYYLVVERVFLRNMSGFIWFIS